MGAPIWTSSSFEWNGRRTNKKSLKHFEQDFKRITKVLSKFEEHWATTERDMGGHWMMIEPGLRLVTKNSRTLKACTCFQRLRDLMGLEGGFYESFMKVETMFHQQRALVASDVQVRKTWNVLSKQTAKGQSWRLAFDPQSWGWPYKFVGTF